MGPGWLLLLLLQVQPVRWSVTAPAARSGVQAGGRVEVRLAAAIAPGWHLYSMKRLEGGPVATTIGLPGGQAFRLAGAVDEPPPLTKFDDSFQMEVEWYEGLAEFTLPVAVAKDAKRGAETMVVNARYQVCDDKQCLPPRTVKVEVPLTVE